jgi:phage baseplate assembly protein W
MPQYIGFSTINADKPRTTNGAAQPNYGVATLNKPLVYGKKFRLVDDKLVIQDFVNALNIPLGSKVGQPGYGTTLWSFVFEPNTADVQFQLENELRRVASLDPRISLDYIKAFPKENGILIEIQMAITPYNQPLTINVFFNQANNRASMQ